MQRTTLYLVFLGLVFYGYVKCEAVNTVNDPMQTYIDSLQTEIAMYYERTSSLDINDLNCFDNIGWTVLISTLSNVSGYLQQYGLFYSAHQMAQIEKKAFIDKLNSLKNDMIYQTLETVSNSLSTETQLATLITYNLTDRVIMPNITYIAIERAHSIRDQSEFLCQGTKNALDRIRLEIDKMLCALQNVEDDKLLTTGREVEKFTNNSVNRLRSAQSGECNTD